MWDFVLALFLLAACATAEIIIVMAFYYAMQERVNGRG